MEKKISFKEIILRKDMMIQFLVTLIAIFISCYFSNVSDLSDTNSIIKYLFVSVPLIVVTAIYGSVNAILCFAVYFIFLLIKDLKYAYIAFYSLLAIGITWRLMLSKMFVRLRTTILSFFVYSICLGVCFYIIYGRIGRAIYSGYNLNDVIMGIVITEPSAFISCITIHMFYCGRFNGWKRYVPDVWRDKTRFPFVDKKIRSIKRRLSVIVFSLVAIVGLSTTFYANYLLPEVGTMFEEQSLINPGNNEILKEEDEGQSEESEEEAEAGNPGGSFIDSFKINERFRISSMDVINRYKFIFNDASKTFDLKLIMLLLNTALPLVVLTNYYVQMRIAKPIADMSETIQDFDNNSDDDLELLAKKTEALNINTRDEIEVLYDALNHYINQLVLYVDKVKEEQRLEEELVIAKATSEAKSNFLSNMSHEIRTPINAVLGMDEMILRETDDKAIIEYANNIKLSGRTLLSLINDILDFSKIEAGKMDIIPVEYELSSVINDLVNMISVKAADKGLELKVEVDPNTPHILYGDEIRIKQCATNVLSNAVKYTQEGSVTLEVGYKECPKVNEASEAEALEDNIILTVRVKDTGIGIKEEDLKKLFSPFERIEEKRNRTIEGTGLGMNIVKQLLDLMDSRLEVASVYGEGSDFYFEIKQKIIDKEPIGDFSEAYRRSLETREKYQVSFKAPDGRILIIDDTPMNLTVIKGLLKETQLNVETGTSGTEALELVTKKKYDLIFLDHMMPEPDGIQTLKAFGSLEGNLNRDTPCIALTANAVSGAREMYLKAGFDDYITKPIDGEVLEKLIKKLMPEEKLILPGQEGYDSQSDDKVKEEKKEDSIIKNLEGIDYESGIKNCMNEDILKGAIGDFYVSIASEPDLIEEAFKSNDLRTYTVKVHALKSSARIIGANELSAMAMELEEAGNAEDIEKINDKTPTLLELYRSYREKLKPFCEKEGDDDDREEIPLDQLEQAYECLREFAESFDFDSADDIMNTLEDYRIPVDYKDKYDKIKQAVTNVDRDELIRLLEDDK